MNRVMCGRAVSLSLLHCSWPPPMPRCSSSLPFFACPSTPLLLTLSFPLPLHLYSVSLSPLCFARHGRARAPKLPLLFLLQPSLRLPTPPPYPRSHLHARPRVPRAARALPARWAAAAHATSSRGQAAPLARVGQGAVALTSPCLAAIVASAGLIGLIPNQSCA
jgi:hypothetical protein